MPRPRKVFKSKAERAKHEQYLARRRESYRDWKTEQMAAQAAEGATDFEALVEAEKTRIEGRKSVTAAKGGSQSPKIMQAAREDLALAFDLIGGVAALVVWGRANPTDFYRLWSKLIPSSAVEASATLPLEDLLSKLAEREGQSVLEAATAIGQETLEEGRRGAELEDLAEIGKNQLN